MENDLGSDIMFIVGFTMLCLGHIGGVFILIISWAIKD